MKEGVIKFINFFEYNNYYIYSKSNLIVEYLTKLNESNQNKKKLPKETQPTTSNSSSQETFSNILEAENTESPFFNELQEARSNFDNVIQLLSFSDLKNLFILYKIFSIFKLYI